MKRIVTIVVLICAIAFQVDAQTKENEKLKKNAEQAVALADKNPTDGMKQLIAAQNLTVLGTIGDKNSYELAINYTHKAIKIAKEQNNLKDTLLARSYYELGNLYLLQGSMDNACDYLELAVETFEHALGRYDPLTIFNRLSAGRIIITAHPDTRRGFLLIMQAFLDNDMAPANKRLKNLNQLNIISNWAMEQMLSAYTNSQRYAVPVVMLNGEKNYIVQTRDWHIGLPLVNWLTPNLLRSEAEQQAHRGENLILMNDKLEFRRLSKEEGKNLKMEWGNFMLMPNSQELIIAPDGSYLFYLNPQGYHEVVKKYEEFINK